MNRPMIDGIAPSRTAVLTNSHDVFARIVPEIIYLNGQPLTFKPNFTPLAAVGVGATLSIITYTGLIKPHLHTSNNQVAAQPVAQTQPTTASATNVVLTPTPAPQPPATPIPTQSEKIQSLLTSFSSAQSAPYFIYVKDLKTGASAGINADKALLSASLYKLFVANQVYMKADKGDISLSGAFAGTTFQACMSRMITVSDNPCGQALGDFLGWSRQRTSLNAQGYTHTNLGASPSRTSASDVALLLENAYNHKYISAESSEAFFKLLKAQRLNDALPQGLPNNIDFAHKTGDLYGYIHDAGIVFGPKSNYIIVAMSGPWANKYSANTSMAKLSRTIYNELQK